MANKLGDPTGNGKIILTQTYHGETHTLPDTQCAIDIRMFANEKYHAVANGVIEGIYTDYISLIPDGCNFRVLYVHTDRPKVVKGQRVVIGQELGQIKSITSPHLHLGLKWKDMHKPAPRVMDYLDRNIPIATSYLDIASEWFVNGQFDWSKHQDLDFVTNLPVHPIVPPTPEPQPEPTPEPPIPEPEPQPTPEPEPMPEPPTPPTTNDNTPTPPITPPPQSGTPGGTTEPKTFWKILIQFFTDLLQRILKSD